MSDWADEKAEPVCDFVCGHVSEPGDECEDCARIAQALRTTAEEAEARGRASALEEVAVELDGCGGNLVSAEAFAEWVRSLITTPAVPAEPVAGEDSRSTRHGSRRHGAQKD